MKRELMIYFENNQEKVAVTYKLEMLVRRAIEATLDNECYGNACEVSVTFTDNEGIRELNRRFRKLDKPTDVLSFPLFDYDGTSGEPPVDELCPMLGDIVLSLEMAEAQGAEFGHGTVREVAFLTVHSMLHLLGYDHETGEEDENEMRARQREVMERLGLGISEEA